MERQHQQLLKLERAAAKAEKKKQANRSFPQRNHFEPLTHIGYAEWDAMQQSSKRSELRRTSSLPVTVDIDDADLPPPGMDNIVLVAKKPKSKD